MAKLPLIVLEANRTGLRTTEGGGVNKLYAI